MANEVVNTVSSFTIREVTGDKRTVRLIGRGLPYRPFVLKTIQRLDVTWYPGFAEATSTVLGAAEEPSTINGTWKDKFIGQEVPALEIGAGVRPNLIAPITENDEAVPDIRQAVYLFDDICRKGQLLEVTWDEQARRGHLREFEKQFRNVHDVEWSMTFEWISRGEAVPPAVVTQEESFGDLASELRADFDGLNAACIPPFALKLDFSSLLDERLATIAGLVDMTTSNVYLVSKLALQPRDAARKLMAACNGVVSEVDAMIQSILALNPIDSKHGTTVTAGSQGAAATTAVVPSTYNERIVADRYFRLMSRAARNMRQTAVMRRAALTQQVEGDVRAIHTSKAGEDLREVSKRYYGTPDQWKTLQVFNGLSGSTLQAGWVVLVPNPNAAALPRGC